MISAQTNTTPIEIGLLEVSPENKAVLEFYFNGQGAELFKLVNTEQAEVILFDYELNESKEKWEKLHLKTNKPGIAISSSEIGIPNTVWLKTPLTSTALSQAATQVKTLIMVADTNVDSNSVELELETNNSQTNENEFSLELVPQNETETSTSDQAELDSQKVVNVKTGMTSEYTEAESQANQVPDAIDSLLDSLNSDIQAREELEITKSDSALEELEPLLDAKIEEEIESKAPETEIDTLLSSLDSHDTNDIELVSEEIHIETNEIQPLSTESLDSNTQQLFTEDTIEVSPTIPEIETSEDILTSSIDELESINSKPIFEDSPVNNDKKESSDLQDMLDEIQLEMEGSSSVPIKNLEGGSQPTLNELHHHDNEVINTPERWELLCGDVNSIKNAAGIKKNAYKIKDHLLSHLLDTVKEARNIKQGMRIKYDDILLFIDPEIDTIYSDTSLYSEEYAHMCFEHVDHTLVKIHTLDLSESRMMHKKLEAEPENAYSIESFLWTSSLLTSRGRLLKHTNTNTIVGLEKWPTLLSLEPIPHVSEIAIAFTKEEKNLLEIPKSLGIPQCYVFAFYNAAVCLNKLNIDSDVLDKNNIKKVSFGFKSKRQTKDKTEKKGFFSRFLKKT